MCVDEPDGTVVESFPISSCEGAYRRIEPSGPAVRRLLEAADVAVFAVFATVWLIALSASQLTDARVALAVHERGLAAPTEIDALLALHVDDLVAAARGSAAVPVPGLPLLGGTPTAAGAATGDAGILRDALLARAAALVYEGGLEVMNDPDGLPIATSTFSTAGGVRRVMELLSATNHERAGLVLWPAECQRPGGRRHRCCSRRWHRLEWCFRRW